MRPAYLLVLLPVLPAPLWAFLAVAALLATYHTWQRRRERTSWKRDNLAIDLGHVTTAATTRPGRPRAMREPVMLALEPVAKSAETAQDEAAGPVHEDHDQEAQR